MYNINRFTQVVCGVLFVFAFSAMASYNIKLDKNSLSFYTNSDFENGASVTGKNTG